MGQIFKNVTILKAEFPGRADFDEAVKALAFVGIEGRDHVVRTAGFVPVEEEIPEMGYSSKMASGYSFLFRIQERILPPSVIAEGLEKRLREYEDSCKRPPHRNVVREEVLALLVPKAFIRTTNVRCVYVREKSVLIVSSVSSKVLLTLYGMLLKALGVNNDNVSLSVVEFSEDKYSSVTQNILYTFLDTGETSGYPLSIYKYVKMSEPSNSEGNTTVFKNLSLEDLQASFSKAFQMRQTIVDSGFSNDVLTFKMSANGKLRSIKFLEDAELDTEFETAEEETQYLLEAESALLCDAFSIVSGLFDEDNDAI